MNQACRLCCESKPLRKSHVIPEFMYKAMYDEKHRFHVISTEESRRNPFMQKGHTETLLCGDCEQKIGEWERYYSLVLRGGIEREYSETENGLLVQGLNYELVKLFEMSILWRASVSEHAMFRHISLGPHEEKLRKALFEGRAKKYWEYGCGIFALLHNGELRADIIDQPETTKYKGLRVYVMIFGGYAWVYFVGSHAPPNSIGFAYLQSDGSRLVMRKKFEELKHLVVFAEQAKSMGRWPRVLL